MRKADEAVAARKRAEGELERVRKETAAAARSEETASRIQSAAQDLVQEDPSRILQANPSPAQRMRLLSRITKQMQEMARDKAEREQLLDHHSKQMQELARRQDASKQRAARELEEKLAARRMRKTDE